MHERPLVPPRRRHLEAITGSLGIWQHADGTTPDVTHGSCTDDVARALTVDLLHRHALGWEAVHLMARRSLAYVHDAFDPGTGSFRNFRRADGSWHGRRGSQDCQGRAMLALGITIREAPEVGMRLEARSLLTAALPTARRLTSPRAVASALLGCDAALDGGMDGEVERTFAHLVARLQRSFAGVDLDGDWPWPEPTLTYENALLPRALLVAARRLSDQGLQRTGLAALDWLLSVQTSGDGMFSPVGNDGWYPRGGTRSRFDQQPIEATATILAAAAAFELTHDPRYPRAAETAYGWFLGDNDVGIPVADVATGACHDGLAARHVNLNQGAESTLMWLTALEAMRLLRSTTAGLSAQRRHDVPPIIGLRP